MLRSLSHLSRTAVNRQWKSETSPRRGARPRRITRGTATSLSGLVVAADAVTK